MRKLIKNKILVLVICVSLITCAYFGVEKLIDEYVFDTNNDLLLDDGSLYEEKMLESEKSDGIVFEDEVDFLVEEEGDRTENNSENISADEVDTEMAREENQGGDMDGIDDETEKIYVYITGEVNVPGVVILNVGSRIVDAINAAGGTTAKANISKVNLVYVLEDGMKVNIPDSSDLKNNPDFEYITMSSGDGASDGSFGGGSSSGSVGSGSGSSEGIFAGSGYSVVNINTASQTELESLPGIGPSLALKIINYRKQNGKFSSIDDIKNVSGIGDSKFESLKKYITV